MQRFKLNLAEFNHWLKVNKNIKVSPGKGDLLSEKNSLITGDTLIKHIMSTKTLPEFKAKLIIRKAVIDKILKYV